MVGIKENTTGPAEQLLTTSTRNTTCPTSMPKTKAICLQLRKDTSQLLEGLGIASSCKHAMSHAPFPAAQLCITVAGCCYDDHECLPWFPLGWQQHGSSVLIHHRTQLGLPSRPSMWSMQVHIYESKFPTHADNLSRICCAVSVVPDDAVNKLKREKTLLLHHACRGRQHHMRAKSVELPTAGISAICTVPAAGACACCNRSTRNWALEIVTHETLMARAARLRCPACASRSTGDARTISEVRLERPPSACSGCESLTCIGQGRARALGIPV